MLGFSFDLSPSLQLTQSIQLTHLQRKRYIETVTQRLHGVVLHEEGCCPYCNYKMTLKEINKGFTANVHDYTTRCPKCTQRFIADIRLNSLKDLSKVTVSFLCPVQTLEALKDKSKLSPPEIKALNTSAYYSALKHFGSLSYAFRKLWIRYKFIEHPQWKKQIKRFLGKLPDYVLGKMVGISPATVKGYREMVGK